MNWNHTLKIDFAPLRPLILVSSALGGALLAAPKVQAADAATLQREFNQPPDNARIMMRWWWFGPSVTKPELEREMRAMKAAGIGGFEVQPTYPLALDDAQTGFRNFKLLSPEFLDALKFTASKAKELGLRMDLTLGSGWPYGGPQFSAAEAAGRLRLADAVVPAGQNQLAVPQLRAGEQVVSAFVGPLTGGQGSSSFLSLEIKENAAQLTPEAAGQKTVHFVIGSQTGMKVKRPSIGGEGYVLDHYSPAVIDKFIKEIALPAIQACAPNPPHAIFCDSFEVAGEDWTPNFLAEFQKRRGYDLKPYLPTLFNDVGPQTREIRYDWGKTLTELFTDNFNSSFQKLAQQQKTLFRVQGYGTPPAALYSYAAADLNEGEGANWKDFEETRWASSASHLLGRPVTSSETWTWLHSPVFRATPLDMKAEADLHFLQGINQLIGHGWPYSAPGVEAPGWRFYAAGALNDQNPWWIVMPDVAKYMQRVSAMLREGQPANDIAVYLPNSDAWASFTPGKVEMNGAVARQLGPNLVRQILESGYNLDFFDDGLLDLRGKVENAALAFGDLKYKVAVLPGVERIPASSLRKLETFARSGGIVVATRRIPAVAPGLKATLEDQKAVQEIAAQLFSGPNPLGMFVEDETQLGAALNKRLAPDVVLSPAEPAIGFVHRQSTDTPIYFLANTSNEPKTVKATFRVQRLQPEWWDPMTGTSRPAAVLERSVQGTTVSLELPAYGSKLLVFTNRKLPTPRLVPATGALPAALDLSTDWKVTFGAKRPAVNMATLRSWTEDEATRNFSGTAVYEKGFDLPQSYRGPNTRLQLDFGPAKPLQPRRLTNGTQAWLESPVQEAAVVFVNDKRVGAVWSPPYTLDVTDFLKTGRNSLRVEVANLAVNAMAGRPLPDYTALNKVYGERFKAQDMDKVQPISSGLTGPIRLIPTAPTQ